MKKKLLAAVILFLAGPGMFGAASVMAEEFTFGQAWREVQLISDVLASEQANVDRSKLLGEATESLNLPQLEISGTYTYLDDDMQVDALDFNPLANLKGNPIGQDIIAAMGGESAFETVVGNQSFGRAALTALWPIYTGGRITAAQNISAAQTDIALQLFDVQRRTLFEELCKAYFGVVLAQQNLSTHRQAEAGFLTHLNNALNLEKEGQIAEVERLSVAVAHDRAKVVTRKSQKAFEIAQVSLRQLLHRNVDVNPTDKLFINTDIPADQPFIISSLDNSPLLKSLVAREQELLAVEDAKRGRYFPEVFLFADYALYQDNSIASDLVPDWQVGIGFTLPLHDRLNRSKNISATLKAQESVSRLSDSTRRALTVATQVAYKEAQQALQEYEGLGSSLELATRNLEMRQKAFTEGFSTSSQLIDAQIFVSAAHTERAAAAYHYILSLSRLLALSGEIDSFGRYQDLAGREAGFYGGKQ